MSDENLIFLIIPHLFLFVERILHNKIPRQKKKNNSLASIIVQKIRHVIHPPTLNKYKKGLTLQRIGTQLPLA